MKILSQYMKWVLQNSSRVGLFSFSKRGNRHTLILASSAIQFQLQVSLVDVMNAVLLNCILELVLSDDLYIFCNFVARKFFTVPVHYFKNFSKL